MNATYEPSVWNDPDFIRDVASGRFECVNLEFRAEPSRVVEKILRKLLIRNLLVHLRPNLEGHGG
jgi:hypothetical protein